ncbi:protein yippee-like isoform X2 [Durio zibethinus]|uniref:Protein yippee-like n=1 Tax=Durio zibethinus TaxID=66656 RepID=A0A6P6AJH1_DURZI|nr:protein yippee-like isoform X2 [Durio zibethinus]
MVDSSNLLSSLRQGNSLQLLKSTSLEDRDCRVNVSAGKNEDRMMTTGLHTVADIFCVGCGSIVGWKYETAHEKNQKYKEGKSVLERFKVSGPDGSNYWLSHGMHVGGSDADDV